MRLDEMTDYANKGKSPLQFESDPIDTHIRKYEFNLG